MREAHSTAIGNPIIAEYRYNGLGFRIGDHTDVTRSGGGAPDGTVDSSDPWYFSCYDESWRIVATFRDSDTDPKSWEIYHNAGLGGFGGSSYIDAMIVRYRDVTNGWAGAADGSLEEARYYCQNWRGDTSLIVTDSGKPVEWVKYSAYGVPFCLKAGDTNSDGTVTTSASAGTDYSTIKDVWIPAGSYDPRGDLDGDVDSNDLSLLAAETLGRGVQSRADTDNRLGYAGYRWDGVIAKDHVRNRVYDPAWGRWLRRDPIGYRDGANLFAYVQQSPISRIDPLGLRGPEDIIRRNVTFDHNRRGAYYEYRASCPLYPDVGPPSQQNEQSSGWERGNEILGRLDNLKTAAAVLVNSR